MILKNEPKFKKWAKSNKSEVQERRRPCCTSKKQGLNGVPPLVHAIQHMHRNVPSSVLCDFISGLQRLEADGPLVVGSLFSCSEISAKVLDCLASHYRSELDIGLVIHHAFMCEKSIIRRQHLRWEFPTAGALYDDAEKIRHGKLANLIESECPTGPLKPPAYARLVHGGFSCVSKSPANSKRSENKGCLSDADNTCETAVTFRAFKDAVAAEHWEIVIAEN